jgi:hypothetical protein
MLARTEVEIGTNDLLDAMTDIRFVDGARRPSTASSPAPPRAAARVHPGLSTP